MKLWYFSLTILLLLNTLGLGLVYRQLKTPTALPPDITSQLNSTLRKQEETASQLTQLQSLISTSLQANQPVKVLGSADLLPEKTGFESATTNRYLAVSATFDQPVAVYQEQADFSAQLGQLIPSYKYPYYLKSNNWYLVGLANNKTGWVKSDHVVEL